MSIEKVSSKQKMKSNVKKTQEHVQKMISLHKKIQKHVSQDAKAGPLGWKRPTSRSKHENDTHLGLIS